MADNEERLRILKMIQEGKISAAEGADLLRALENGRMSTPPEPLVGPSPPRWFRVRVTDLRTGRNKVNVNIPMGLVSVGLKMGARFAPSVEGFDYEQLMDAVQSGQQGKIVDVVNNEEGERVEIFVE